MAIHFPCLLKDLSFWVPQQPQQQQQHHGGDSVLERDLVDTLKRFLIHSDQAGANARSGWLRSDESKAGHVMAPVLRDTPRSHWLIDGHHQQQENNAAANPGGDVRAANLSTSLWLASTSHEPLTCVTRSSKKALVEWPSILSRTDLWLAAKEQPVALDNWLAKNHPASSSAADLLVLDNRKKEEDLTAWLIAKQQEAQDKDCSSSSSLVEKWLCLAAAEDGGEDDMEVQDDESSIGILEGEEEEDFHIVVERSGNDFWLL